MGILDFFSSLFEESIPAPTRKKIEDEKYLKGYRSRYKKCLHDTCKYCSGSFYNWKINKRCNHAKIYCNCDSCDFTGAAKRKEAYIAHQKRKNKSKCKTE